MTRAFRPFPWLLVPSLLLVAASAGAAPSRGPSHDLGATPSSCSALQPGSQPVNVHWSSVRVRPTSCFFFSGPGALGREDPLGTVATLDWGREAVRLSFGAAAFVGARTGSSLELTRQSTHAFSGQWRVTEHMRGDEVEVGPDCQGLLLTYAYEECQEGRACPGRCHIDALLTVTRR